jgi:alpha-tubulin suppressor-like RCC1 family protein
MLDAGVTSLSAGSSHACAIKTGNLYCWGLNANGQLGTGDATNRLAPVQITSIGAVTEVSAGLNFTCAIVTGGAVKCWGLGTSGQLGNATVASSLIPVAVSGADAGAVAISAGSTHACALIGDGVKCWGANASGQLGDGSVTARSIATIVSSLGVGSGVTSISAGLAYSCAIVKGVPYCWGLNANGQAGTPAGTNRLVPGIVAATLPSGFLRISAALDGQQTCAMSAPKNVHCWGQGSSGQLGIGSAPTMGAPSATPISF